ncbi:hypothetical protein BP00DRAFT_49064 [Aspergillus indologenus CBS 114.80]|uniref:Uncharacterized protein n=1 Tax=Aspergillus indologenus CBS 114.80 TaxID=1450541 RepID=A0A2V5IDY5_9EURO|nr:hypothetical protein BP00DRAFT_49064 [Aspergillus indologenus CBS 114.80]
MTWAMIILAAAAQARIWVALILSHLLFGFSWYCTVCGDHLTACPQAGTELLDLAHLADHFAVSEGFQQHEWIMDYESRKPCCESDWITALVSRDMDCS